MMPIFTDDERSKLEVAVSGDGSPAAAAAARLRAMHAQRKKLKIGRSPARKIAARREDLAGR